MPVTCTQCGKELPRDDARFCSNCGAPVVQSVVPPTASAIPPIPLMPLMPHASQVNTPPKAPQSSLQGFPQESRHVLREQIAHQPRPARLTRDISLENNRPASSPQALESERPELRVRVWDQEHESAQQPFPIDELPTQETPASPMFMPSPVPESAPLPSERPLPASPLPLSLPGIQSHMDNPNLEQERRREQIAQQSTSLMSSVSNVPVAPPEPRPTPFLGIQGIQNLQKMQSAQAKDVSPFPAMPPTPVLNNVPSTPATQVQQPPMSYVVPVEQVKPIATGLSSLSPQLPRQQMRRGPGPLVLLGVVILALIIAGAAWVAIVQPFNVPSVTKPLRDYRDTQLRVALSYPSDWTITHSPSSLLFSDSSQTAQVMITVSGVDNAPGGNVGTYLQKQAAKVNMTGAKTITKVTFAGTTWQQIQGNVQKNGVNEIETLFATVHNNQLYVLTQSAPQSVYADEESLTFSKMRASLQLL